MSVSPISIDFSSSYGEIKQADINSSSDSGISLFLDDNSESYNVFDMNADSDLYTEEPYEMVQDYYLGQIDDEKLEQIHNQIEQDSTSFNWNEFYDYNSTLGDIIGQQADKCSNTKSGGYCLSGVVNILSNAFRSMGVDLPAPNGEINSAYELCAAFSGVPDKEGFYAQVGKFFNPCVVPREFLDDLPRGCVVVWNQCEGHPHGHVSVTTGDGREVSDFVGNQIMDLNPDVDLNYDFEYMVFVPVGLRNCEQ